MCSLCLRKSMEMEWCGCVRGAVKDEAWLRGPASCPKDFEFCPDMWSHWDVLSGDVTLSVCIFKN